MVPITPGKTLLSRRSRDTYETGLLSFDEFPVPAPRRLFMVLLFFLYATAPPLCALRDQNSKIILEKKERQKLTFLGLWNWQYQITGTGKIEHSSRQGEKGLSASCSLGSHARRVL